MTHDTGKLPPRAPGKSRQDPREPVLHRAEQYPARGQASYAGGSGCPWRYIRGGLSPADWPPSIGITAPLI